MRYYCWIIIIEFLWKVKYIPEVVFKAINNSNHADGNINALLKY